MTFNEMLEELCSRHMNLRILKGAILDAARIIIRSYENGGKILVCGNGGSSSDSGHIVAELMKGFRLKRPIDSVVRGNLKKLPGERGKILSDKLQQGLPAISLSSHNDLLTAIINDIDGDLIFAQQVLGYGRKGDVLLAISCSGSSQDVIDALIIAKALGLSTVGLTGISCDLMKEYCDVLIDVPENDILLIQEMHIPVYHTLCLMVENYFFAGKDTGKKS